MKKDKEANSYNLRVIEVAWSGTERMPEDYEDIPENLFYSVGAPYAIAFLEQFPQAATFKIVEAV